MDQIVVKRLAYSPRKVYAEHAHKETQITMFVSGAVEEKVCESWRTIGPLEFVVKPAGLKHTNRFCQSGAQTIQLSLSPDAAKTWGIVGDLSGYHTNFCPYMTQQFLSMFSSPRRQDEMVMDHAWMVKLIRGLNPMKRPNRRAPHWLNSVFQQTEQEFNQTVSVKELASQHNRHPVSIARAFRAQYGTSIKQHICKLRVQHAAKYLCGGELSAAEIALICGFSDQSHMNRVFKSVAGIPPIQFRRFVFKHSC